MSRLALSITCSLMCTALLRPGLSAQAPQFKAGTELVDIPVTVLDRKGVPVRGLHADAFSVTEDDVRRDIALFRPERVPLSLAVTVDASKSMKGNRFRLAGEAIREFFDHLQPGDEIGITGFNDQPLLIAPFTTDATAALSALSFITPVGMTALYGGVENGLDFAATGHNLRQVVIVISDGNDDTTKIDLVPLRERAAVERIRRSGALVYAIGLNVRSWESVDPAGLFEGGTLARLSEPSGGFAAIVTSAASLPAAARAIREDLDAQYTLGIVPAHQGDGRFHRLKVSVAGCECRVRARAGFVAPRTP